ncbi:hypothetical protein HQ545_08245 [Candidatus Woesearchaeota archaeon]|nr:hypothetical protein [Candidatus Woesearchaeota archaeon]
MRSQILLKDLEGIHTIKSIMIKLKINKTKAIYFVHLLRNDGYVKTKRLSDKTRVYNISVDNRLKGVTYEEIINTYSPIKISTPKRHKLYGKKPSLELTLIYAIKTRSVRTILAAISLFKKIDDWTALYHLAKVNHIERQVGALYDISRKIIRTKRMSKKFRNNALPEETYAYRYIIPGLQSKDFRLIEKKWRVYIPFNKKDLVVYR